MTQWLTQEIEITRAAVQSLHSTVPAMLHSIGQVTVHEIRPYLRGVADLKRRIDCIRARFTQHDPVGCLLIKKRLQALENESNQMAEYYIKLMRHIGDWLRELQPELDGQSERVKAILNDPILNNPTVSVNDFPYSFAVQDCDATRSAGWPRGPSQTVGWNENEWPKTIDPRLLESSCQVESETAKLE
ncbi:hypothetical protein N7462_005061 [Penicillium macrosclerotiorum]|uniref:uncharacterized protein n=1 Tax=Penicillium macrosclerotiorum TaxID=303699 RepID=UPI002547854A|nr:uncharacterized protein N7462_005061 [Penicillium macrosclerotiorum]KAJ5690669.1 hypothetical protein N7462_005061 [Penicillium macrosclerotiorum]